MGLQDHQGVVTRLSELSAVSMGKLSLSPWSSPPCRKNCSLQGSCMTSCMDLINSCFGRVRELWGALQGSECGVPRSFHHNSYKSVLPPLALSPETGIMPMSMNTSILPLPKTGSSPEDYISLAVNYHWAYLLPFQE